MHVLVLNLTRFGDLIQTQPVLAGFKSRGDRVSLVCLDNFAAAAQLLDSVDHVVPFPGARLLSLLDRDWRLAVAELEKLRFQACGTQAPDLVVNLTPSLPARLLARVFQAVEIVGFGVDEHGFNADSSAWAVFLQVGSSNRGASPFNVVDLFCRAAGLGSGPYPFRLRGPGDEIRQRMLRLVRDRLPGGDVDNGLVGIQLGASEERRRWPVAHFARCAEYFWRETGRPIVVFGSGTERHLAERFLAEADCPAVSLAGETSLEELAGALSGLSILVTNDTGTMHLAAGLGVPVAAVFLATAQPFDTGPYAENCLCFEPDMECHPCAFGSPCDCGEACRHKVLPELLFAHAHSLLDGVAPPEISNGARVWRTQVGATGLMELQSLSGHETTDRTGWIRLQREHYCRFLDGLDPELMVQAPVFGAPFRAGLVATLGEARDVLFLLTRQIGLLGRVSVPDMKHKFMANCQRLQTIFEKHPSLDVLGTLWFFQLQREGVDLGRLALLIKRYHALVTEMLHSLDDGTARFLNS